MRSSTCPLAMACRRAGLYPLSCSLFQLHKAQGGCLCVCRALAQAVQVVPRLAACRTTGHTLRSSQLGVSLSLWASSLGEPAGCALAAWAGLLEHAQLLHRSACCCLAAQPLHSCRYACYYLTRNSLTYTAPVMVADASLKMDITQVQHSTARHLQCPQQGAPLCCTACAMARCCSLRHTLIPRCCMLDRHTRPPPRTLFCCVPSAPAEHTVHVVIWFAVTMPAEQSALPPAA